MTRPELRISSAMRNLYCIYLILTMCFANVRILRLASVAVLALMFVLYGMQMPRRRGNLLLSSPGIYSLFVVFALSSCLWAVSLERSKAVMYELITSLLFIMIVADSINTPKKLSAYIEVFLIATLLMCTRLLIGCRLDIMSLRYSGTTIIGLDKNYFSQICAFSIAIGLYFYRTTKKKSYLLNMLFCLLVIIGSGSRKAFLSIGLSIIIMYGFAYRHSIHRFLRYILMCCLLAAIVVIYLYRTKPQFISNIINGILVFFINDASVSDTSASIRIALIHLGMELFFHNPILGCGLNNFSFFSGNINVYGGYMYAHNNYVELLADFGIVGFAIYYAAYGLYFYKLTKAKERNYNIFYIALSFSIMIGLLVNDIASVSYYMKMYQLFMVFAYKIITIGARADEKK